MTEGAGTEKKKRPIWQWGLLGVIVITCLCVVIIAVLPDSSEEPSEVADIAKEIVEDVDKAPPENTDVPEPSSTPAPTDTPSPTNTPRPTETPLPPTPTPEPIVIEGSGQDVTDPFIVPSSINIATLNHSGYSNFSIWAYGPEGEKELLVNTIGNYSGSVPIFGDGEWFLEITADGAWIVTIEVIHIDESVVDGITGTGDYVSGLFFPDDGDRIPFEFSHDGQSNFAVWLHCAGGSDLLQNEIGPVDNAAVVEYDGSPCLWEVTADGNWSIKPR